ncbi:arginase family protein [Actinoplanes sp. NPDC049548]|uniref:arginase family protein n=1 Tax=Actinoplanes sp. NPDC049548 TaxID=3155152 RepID=UPI00341EF6F2
MRRIAVLDAPSNLGLRPPTATSVPGCAKAPGALRDQGLLRRLNARDAGCLTPPRYDPGDWRPGDGVCHAPEIALYSRRLADRIGAIIDQGEFPVVLGGDCSIVLGSALAMHRLGEAVGGRIGLVFVDGHSDFRHPGNASYVGAAAGEDLALVTGRGQPNLASIEGRRPYYRDIDVVVMGIRAQDEYRLDLQAAGIVTRPVPTLRVEGAARSAQWAREQLVDCAGYWVHLDVDVLDPAVMPAVDAPEPGGIAFPELELLLAGLVESPHCLGVEITVFDPDYDPDGGYAEEITSAIVAGLKSAHTVDLRPDLIAARADLLAPSAPGRLASSAPGRRVPAAAHDEHSPATVDPELSVAVVGDSSAAFEPDTSDSYAARRAEAASADIAGAAAGASVGVGGAEQTAVPATTLSAVADAAEVDARPVEETGPVVDSDADATAGAGSEAVDPTDLDTEAHTDLDAEALADLDGESGAVADDDARVGSAVHADPAVVADAVLDRDAITDVEPVAVDVVVGEPVDSHLEADEDPVDAELVEDEHADPPLRPLGSAPLLDSEPLPATMPGMLRPRPVEEFSLPAQRPAFELGPEKPADIT